ncbi:hypothetical protein LMG26857_03766 [Achromobacter anxifer]|nr:hypothetical protein LMG26857_03766 [Achromobacter anxifer]
MTRGMLSRHWLILPLMGAVCEGGSALLANVFGPILAVYAVCLSAAAFVALTCAWANAAEPGGHNIELAAGGMWGFYAVVIGAVYYLVRWLVSPDAAIWVRLGAEMLATLAILLGILWRPKPKTARQATFLA